VLIINQQAIDPPAAKLNSCGQASRAAADDEDSNFYFLDWLRFSFFFGIDRRKFRQPNKRLNLHPGFDYFHTGFNRKAISQHQTLGALAIGTENALRGSIPMMIAKNSNPIGKESRSNGFALSGS
jgi:hypothetical protein